MVIKALSKKESLCILCLAFSLPMFLLGCATGRPPQKKAKYIDLNTITEEHPSIVSPNGHYVLYAKVFRDDFGTIDYTVYLKNLFAGTAKEILKYQRGASAQWSPDSKHLLVNWGVGSSESTCLIFKIGNPTSGPFGYEGLFGKGKSPTDPIDICALLREHDPEEDFCFVNSGKLYMDGEWRDNTRIELYIHGYENEECYPHGFDFLLDYVLGKGFEDLRQVKPREN